MRSSVSKGSSGSHPTPLPKTSKASRTRKELSLSDLPATEKDKIARLAQRLISLGREHEQCKARAEETERECQRLGEEHCRLQEENKEAVNRIHTCYGLIRLYQDKLTDMVDLAEERDRGLAVLQFKCDQFQEDIARQAELVASQRTGLESFKLQSSAEAASNAELVKKLESEKKTIMATTIQKDETIETQRKKIAFLESSLALKESAIVNLETSVMRLQGEVDFRAKQQEKEKSAMQEILQKTLSELDTIKSSHLLSAGPHKNEPTVDERVRSEEKSKSEIDVPWDSSASENDLGKSSRKTYPLRKPVVVKRQRKRSISTTAVIAESDAVGEESAEARPVKEGAATKPKSSKISDARATRISDDRFARKNENWVNAVPAKEEGSGVECKRFDVYDGRLFKLLGEIDTLGLHDR